MTPDEIINLLTVAAAYDRRKAGQADVHAWADAAARARWTYPEALDAVKAHYANSSEWLMPAHITEAIRARRTQPAPVAELELPSAPAADPVHVRAALTEIATKLGWERAVGDTGMRVRCPHCGVAIGSRCVNPQTGKPLTQSPCHPARAQAAAEAS